MGALRLGRRLVGRRDLVQALVIVATPMAVLLALFMTIHALTLSPAQLSDMSFGRFAGSVFLPGTTKTLDGTPPRTVISEVRRDAPAGESAVVLSSSDLRWDQLPRFQNNNVSYVEADWAKRPYGNRFSVLAGRMPRRLGEVAVTGGLLAAPLGHVLTAASGNIRLKVVGVIRDRFARSSRQVLGAAGTWASFDWHKLNRSGFELGSGVLVLGNFRHWAKLASLSERYQQRYTGGFVGTGVNNRSTVAANPPQSYVEREALVYRVPASAIAVLCPLLLLGLRGRRARRWAAILRAIGVRPGRSALAVTGGSIAVALIAIPVGAVAGELVGLLARLAPLANGPLSPPVSVLGETARFAVAAAVAMLAAGLTIAFRQRGYSVQQLLARRPPARLMLTARLVVLLVSVAGIAYLAPGLKAGSNSITVNALAAVAVCLVIPDVLAGLRRVSAGRGVRWRLVTGRLMIDRGKSVAVCAALIACVGPFVAISAERAAEHAREQATRALLIPPGQVAVGTLPRSAVDRIDPRALAITKRVTGQQPIEITQLVASRNLYSDPPSAILAPNGRAPQTSNFAPLLGVPSVAALRQLLGDNLTAHAATVAARGGVVHFDGFGEAVPSPAPIGLGRVGTPGVRLPKTTPPVEVASIANDHAWSSQGSGFILNSTARRLGLPMHAHLAAFTHIIPETTKEIAGALRKAGLPVQALLQTEPFQYQPEPAGLLFGRYSMLALLAVLMTVALGSTARSLRDDSRSLIAIGLRRSWARRALALQSVTLTVIGLLGGILAGAVSVGIYVAQEPMDTVAIPVGQLAILITGSIAIAVLTASLASRRLTPRKPS